MRLKSLSLILTPTTLHRHITHTQPTKLPFITFPTYFSKFFTQSGILRLLRLTPAVRFTTAFFDSTLCLSFDCFDQLFLHTRVPRQMALCREFRDDLLMASQYWKCAPGRVPRTFLTSLVSTLQLASSTQGKNLSRINPKSLIYPNARCKNEIKGKENHWITIDYMTDYAIKEYRLRNI